MVAEPAVGAESVGPDPGALGAEGFFRVDGELLVPAEFATSPWGRVLHGRLIGGLTARATEGVRAGDPELACGRLTIDMFRSARVAPVRVESRTVRAGRRIVVLEVTVEQEDGPIGQGRAVLLRRSEQPDAPLLRTPRWDVPAPAELGPPRPPRPGRTWTAPWHTWGAGGSPGGMWIRETHPLITGEELTPLVRLALAADLASPAANSSADGLHFINADYTVYLGREPRGAYTGIQPSGHISEHGVAAGQCVVHDLDGPVGFVATTAVANPRPH
ncbi:MAG TPA: acyl-CoA thioesterase domain-containing protein [Streptosporangiaceae bacterium]|jgi:hypothetical protein